MTDPRPGVFLTAEWRHLAMLNYEAEPALLAPLVPSGTELDEWRGRTYVSAVGFLFLETRVLGLSIPFHTRFEEVNLRFYVRRKAGGEWRRGVVFVKELVPRWAIAFVARTRYGERYVSLPMGHRIELGEYGEPSFVSYSFRHAGRDGSTTEYAVEHPSWRVSRARDARLDADVAALYGERFVGALSARPSSAFLAEGSAVTVRRGVRVVP